MVRAAGTVRSKGFMVSVTQPPPEEGAGPASIRILPGTSERSLDVTFRDHNALSKGEVDALIAHLESLPGPSEETGASTESGRIKQAIDADAAASHAQIRRDGYRPEVRWLAGADLAYLVGGVLTAVSAPIGLTVLAGTGVVKHWANREPCESSGIPIYIGSLLFRVMPLVSTLSRFDEGETARIEADSVQQDAGRYLASLTDALASQGRQLAGA